MNPFRDEEDDPGVPPEDLTAFLDRLEAELGMELPEAVAVPPPPLSGEEIDELVNQVLDEELARLEEAESRELGKKLPG
jgi:hypothetical protein